METFSRRWWKRFHAQQLARAADDERVAGVPVRGIFPKTTEASDSGLACSCSQAADVLLDAAGIALIDAHGAVSATLTRCRRWSFELPGGTLSQLARDVRARRRAPGRVFTAGDRRSSRKRELEDDGSF
jgi:hypothetical protein